MRKRKMRPCTIPKTTREVASSITAATKVLGAVEKQLPRGRSSELLLRVYVNGPMEGWTSPT